MMAQPLAAVYRALKATGRGKHVGRFSYYHRQTLVLADGAEALLKTLAEHGAGASLADFNVVKLDAGQRVSFLSYETFVRPFPALLYAISCDLEKSRTMTTDYSQRRNPPILHRKELLLPEPHPLVAEAAALTRLLESRGAFERANQIGTRDQWRRRLAELRLAHLLD